MGWSPNHGHVKERYNPVMNAREKRHEKHVQKQPCFGCGVRGCSAHHTLLNFPMKRWRRDHRWLLPVCWECHQGNEGIHGIGSEVKWLARMDLSEQDAIDHMDRLWRESE